MVEREEVPDMCYVCGFGASRLCNCPAVKRKVGNDSINILKEMQRRAKLGFCKDAMFDNPEELDTEPNLQGLVENVGGGWNWMKRVLSKYIDMGITGEREDPGGRKRGVHTIKPRKK